MLRHVLNAGGRAAVSASRPQRYVPPSGGDIVAASEERGGERAAVAKGGIAGGGSLNKLKHKMACT